MYSYSWSGDRKTARPCVFRVAGIPDVTARDDTRHRLARDRAQKADAIAETKVDREALASGDGTVRRRRSRVQRDAILDANDVNPSEEEAIPCHGSTRP